MRVHCLSELKDQNHIWVVLVGLKCEFTLLLIKKRINSILTRVDTVWFRDNVYTHGSTDMVVIMLSEVKKWGNSAAVRLPSKVLAAAGLDTGAPISIEVIDSKVVIELADNRSARRLNLPFTEAQLLSGLNEQTSHADELAELSSVELGD